MIPIASSLPHAPDISGRYHAIGDNLGPPCANPHIAHWQLNASLKAANNAETGQ